VTSTFANASAIVSELTSQREVVPGPEVFFWDTGIEAVNQRTQPDMISPNPCLARLRFADDTPLSN
jgi:hypothetical protein